MAKIVNTLPRGKYKIIFLIALLVFISSVSVFTNAIEPNGASINATRSERANASQPTSQEAQAGNVTQLNIFAYSTTQSWQGYFGNVSGVIQLADSNSYALYNWSLANPQGEVYASTNATISWTNIQCFNYTATGTYTNEAGNGGTVNLYGTNLTLLESQFGIKNTSVDGVDETFTLIHGGAGQHDEFYTANKQFSEGECISTRLFSNTGTGENDKFEEVLLYEPTTASIIFTALIEPENVAGFDGNDYDFEMLVLENGRNGDTATTTYYFFVELE